MKPFICLGVVLLSAPLHAEIYSWIDDSGTYHYTEDYSKVPKKYHKKVKRGEDERENLKPPMLPDLKTAPGHTEITETKLSGEKEELYGGKSRDAWHKEMTVLEAELKSIGQHIEQVKSQVTDAKKLVSNVQLEALKNDYENSLAAYNQKYKSYTELIETIRKAGIIVEIKKENMQVEMK